MLDGFKDIPHLDPQAPLAGFELLEAEKREGFTLTISKSRFFLSAAVGRFLQSDYVQIMTNVADRKLAIVPATQTTRGNFKLSRSYGSSTRMLTSKRAIQGAEQFDNLNLANYKYRFDGERVEDNDKGALIFDIGHPTEVEAYKGGAEDGQ